MRAEQYNLIRQLEAVVKGKGNTNDIIFQLLMGGGKTSVILSSLLDIVANLSDKKKLGVLVLHPSQYDAVLGNLQEYQRERFEQELIPIEYTRDELGSDKQVKVIWQKLQRAQRKGHGIALRSTMLQSLLLEMRAVATQSAENTKVSKTRIETLGKILNLSCNLAQLLQMCILM